MVASLTDIEVAQLTQTIEMFEVIAQSQPHDYQSLEILKEAYSKLGRTQDVANTSKRIAKAYEEQGQLSMAILEYEGILEVHPQDADVLSALGRIQSRTDAMSTPGGQVETDFMRGVKSEMARPDGLSMLPSPARRAAVDDGRQNMRRLYVDGKFMTPSDFDKLWVTPEPDAAPGQPLPPFIQVLHDSSIVNIDQSLKLLCERARLCFLPLEKYDVDMDVARQFPKAVCQRWCVVPFDRMSRTVLVATANPFNVQAVTDLKGSTSFRFLWYLAPPADLLKVLQKVFR